MFALYGAGALGTILPQNKSFEYYVQNYPDGPHKVLGFLSYDVLLTLQLDHIYSSWWFYSLAGLLAASLAACTYTRQLPAVKVVQRWKFLKLPSSLAKMGPVEVLPNARINDLGRLLAAKDYQVFIRDGSLYAFKGLAGRIGPIGVHAALLLVLFGTAYSGFGGYKGSVMCPEGQDFMPAPYMSAYTPLSPLAEGAQATIHVNDFSIDYRPDGQVAQYYSDLSVITPDGQEVMRKTIRVNDPLRYKGVTLYQTDWSLAAVRLRVLEPSASAGPAAPAVGQSQGQQSQDTPSPAPSEGREEVAGGQAPGSGGGSSGEVLLLPMASLEGRPGVSGRLWATFLPLEESTQPGKAPRGLSILARDMQSVAIYDGSGKFIGVRRPGSNKVLEVEGVRLVVDDVVGSTGMEVKSDPGVPIVYAGFGALLVTTFLSYLSHSQVWALMKGSDLYVSGKTNRALVMFQQEMDAILNLVPELPPAQVPASVPAPGPEAAQRVD